MFRKLLALIVLAAAVWLGARYFAQRGQIRFTVVVHEAGAVRKGDPVVENDQTVGRVTQITHLDGQDAVIIRLEREHRRDIVSDSLFSVENRRIGVNNTFAIGKPIVEKVKRAADEKLDSIDAELASATAKAPEWKREGKDVFDKNLDALQKKIEKTSKDLE